MGALVENLNRPELADNFLLTLSAGKFLKKSSSFRCWLMEKAWSSKRTLVEGRYDPWTTALCSAIENLKSRTRNDGRRYVDSLTAPDCGKPLSPISIPFV